MAVEKTKRKKQQQKKKHLYGQNTTKNKLIVFATAHLTFASDYSSRSPKDAESRECKMSGTSMI